MLNEVRLVTLLCVMLLAFGRGHAQARRNLEQTRPNVEQLAGNGKYYAVIIGINNYPEPLSKLTTAVNDATAVAGLLKKSYGFEIKGLYLDKEATRVNILTAINKLRDTLRENDSLLIYYAGHGYLDRLANKAYWLPVDADSIYSANRIIADDITVGIRGQNARHVLIISDSCYSGGLTRDLDSPERSGGNAIFIDRMYRGRSRTLMSSGGVEPVADGGKDGHSVFAYTLLRSLQLATQPVFTASDLFYNSVRQRVIGNSAQKPQYYFIQDSGHDDGDFIFTKTDAVVASTGHDSGAAVSHGDQFRPPVQPNDLRGTLLLKAPAGAEIHIDELVMGHSTGEPLRFQVDPGNRTVEIFLPGYRSWKQIVQVQTAKLSSVTANPVPAENVSAPDGKSVTAMADGDLAAIRTLLDHYAHAVTYKDFKELKMIWPEVRPQRVDQYKSLPKGARLSLSLLHASAFNGNENAVLRCKQTYEIEGKSQEDNLTLYIGRLNAGWIINEIASSN